MWSLAQQSDATEAALARLDDPDPELRCLFVRLLAKLRSLEAAPALIPLLADPVPRVVSTAIQALGQLGDPATVPPLVALLDTEPVPSPVIIETLSGFGEAALDALTAVLALGEIGSAGRAGIERALADPELAGVARRLLLDLHAT
jgi:HEAT repeat protein